MGRRPVKKPLEGPQGDWSLRLFPDEASAWLPDATPDPPPPLELVWWLSHCEPLVLMAARRRTTRAWHSYVVLPEGPKEARGQEDAVALEEGGGADRSGSG